MLENYNTNQSTADGTLVFIEVSDKKGVQAIEPVSKQLLGKASEMGGGRIFGVIFGGPERKELYKEAFSYGVDTLYHVRDPRLSTFHPEAYAESIAAVCERIIPAVVLFGSTPRGAELAPRAAASMGTGIVTDCSDLAIEGRMLSMFRVSEGKKVRYECVTFPQVATVKEGVFPSPAAQEGRGGTAFYWQYGGNGFKQTL
jgi:electron transfer flavoprotein alpha subunit